MKSAEPAHAESQTEKAIEKMQIERQEWNIKSQNTKTDRDHHEKWIKTQKDKRHK